MKQMPSALAFVVCLATMQACEKKKEPVRTPEHLLTIKEWKVSGIGFDDNTNGKIDASEQMMKECEKDNTISFYSNGNGHTKDNQDTCGGVTDGQFTWKLLNNDSVLEISSNKMDIVVLNERELMLKEEEFFTVPLLIQYKR